MIVSFSLHTPSAAHAITATIKLAIRVLGWRDHLIVHLHGRVSESHVGRSTVDEEEDQSQSAYTVGRIAGAS